MSQLATLREAHDKASLRTAAVTRALAESEAAGAAGSAAHAEPADALEQQGETWEGALEHLRAEAVRGQERAAMVEAQAAELLDEIAAGG